MNVLMPQLGETVTEGTVAKWHKKVGDTVVADEIILDIETDKVSMEIPAPGDGVITQILVPGRHDGRGRHRARGRREQHGARGALRRAARARCRGRAAPRRAAAAPRAAVVVAAMPPDMSTAKEQYARAGRSRRA